MLEMRNDGKTAIIVALIGVIGTILAAIIGAKWGKENVNVIVQIDGKNVVLDDSEVQKIAEENENLKDEISQYENTIDGLIAERSELAKKLGDANGELSGIPSIEFQNIGLSIDGEEKAINKEKSSVFINGIQYYSEEFVDNLLPESSVSTIKDGMFYVGKIVKEKYNLFDLPIITQTYNSRFYDSMEDTYGNMQGKSLYLEYNGDSVTFNTGREYAYFKCVVAMHKGSVSTGYLQIEVDDDIIYTSEKISNMTEPFEVDLPINAASTVTVETIGDGRSCIFVSNAVVYNQE